MNKLPKHAEKLTKEFTVKNLLADKACKPGLDFVRPIIEAGGNVPQALKAHNGEWVQWAIRNRYDVRELWHDMNGEYSYMWDDYGRMFVTAGDNSTLTAGNNSILKAGDCSTLKAGNDSIFMAGHVSILKAGDCSTLRARDYSTLIAKIHSTLTAGNDSNLAAGNNSTLKAGDNSTLTAGYNSTLTAGNNSTLTAEHNSTFTAGLDSWLICWSKKNDVRKRCAAYVGDGGLKPNTPYKCINWEWVEVES